MTDWHVAVHNDEMNVFPVVVDVLNRVVGLKLDDAAEADDLIRVLGVTRNATRKPAVANYLTAVQHLIVVTLRPELMGVGPQ